MSSSHAGGFTCAEVEKGTEAMAAAVSRLRDERDAARDTLERVRAWLKRNGHRAFATRSAYRALREIVEVD